MSLVSSFLHHTVNLPEVDLLKNPVIGPIAEAFIAEIEKAVADQHLPAILDQLPLAESELFMNALNASIGRKLAAVTSK